MGLLFFKKSPMPSWAHALRSTKIKAVGSSKRFTKNVWRWNSRSRAYPFVPQKELLLTYRGRPLKQIYKPDFICFEKIIVEIKAVSDIGEIERAQVHNYLKATGCRFGLLINFGHYPLIKADRIIH